MARLRTYDLARAKGAEMSEQSLFRRSAPYKPYSGSQKRGLKVKCCGVTVCFIISKAIENVPESVFKDC